MEFFYIFFRVLCKIYPYKLSRKLRGKRNALYAMWIEACHNGFEKGNTIQDNIHIVGGKYIKVGHGNYFRGNVMLSVWTGVNNNPSLTIGNDCSFGYSTHISSCNKVTIGNNVLTGMFVYISDNSHGAISRETLSLPPLQRPLFSKGGVVIEDNVWIGNNVVILSNVHIGRGAVIAANAVVIKDVPAYSVVGGVPAQLIKQT